MNKEKILNFLYDKYNLIFLGIILFDFILKFILFNMNQAVWWDESEYLAVAKNWAFGINYDYPPQRPVLFPFLSFLIYKIGLNELAIRFFLVLIPSVGSIIFTYLIGKEIFDKKIALIASFLMSIFWVLLFNTARIHTDALALFFSLCAIYFFWKGYIKKESKKYIWLMGLFFSLAFLTRVSALLIPLIFIIYLLITEHLKFLKNKDLWISILIAFIVFSPQLIWSYFYFKDVLAFTTNYTLDITAGGTIAWNLFGMFSLYLGQLFFIIFLIGLIKFINLFIGFDLVITQKDKNLNKYLFTLIWILVVLFFFIFYIRLPGAEPRWLMLMAIPTFYITGEGFILIYNFLKKYNKIVAIGIILILLIIGGYIEVTKAINLIKERKDSYVPVKLAGLWIKENSNKEDIIISMSRPQITYYSERYTISPAGKIEEEMNEMVKKYKPRYYMDSIFEMSNAGYREWMREYGKKYNLKPVQIYFADPERKNAILIIYEF